MLLRRTKRSLDWSNSVFCSIAIKPLAPEPGGPHPKSNVTMKGAWSAASHQRTVAWQISTILPPPSHCLPVCFWDPDLRTIPTFVARMSQMAWDACAIVLLVNEGKGCLRGASPASLAGRTLAPRALPYFSLNDAFTNYW